MWGRWPIPLLAGAGEPTALRRRCAGRNLISAFSRRSWNERAGVAHSLAIGLIVELGLRTVSLGRLCRLLGITLLDSHAISPKGDSSGNTPTGSLSARERDADAVLRHWPWGDTCLRRALVVGRLRRHEHPSLCIGVGRDGDRVIAHAWLEVDGEPISTAPSPDLVRLTVGVRRPGAAPR